MNAFHNSGIGRTEIDYSSKVNKLFFGFIEAFQLQWGKHVLQVANQLLTLSMTFVPDSHS